MGLSISFRGRQQDPGLRAQALESGRRFAHDMEWGASSVSVEAGRGFLGHRVLQAPRLRGLALLPHFASDPVPLVFVEDEGLLVDSYVKDEGDRDIALAEEPLVNTLFAGAAVHREVCAFLAELRERYVPDLEVDDETGYFHDPDEDALERTFDQAWERVALRVKEAGHRPGEVYSVGGCTLRMPHPGEEAPAEFSRVAPGHRELISRLESELVARYGGFEFHLDRSLAGLRDLDLLMGTLDEEGLKERLEDPEVEAVAHGLGAWFGRTLVHLLGGTWELDDEDGRLVLCEVGGVGLRVDPFQVAADRLVGGPCHGFEHHLALYQHLAASLAEVP